MTRKWARLFERHYSTIRLMIVCSLSGQLIKYIIVAGTDATLECTWNDLENPEDIEVVKWTFKGRRLREG